MRVLSIRQNYLSTGSSAASDTDQAEYEPGEGKREPSGRKSTPQLSTAPTFDKNFPGLYIEVIGKYYRFLDR